VAVTFFQMAEGVDLKWNCAWYIGNLSCLKPWSYASAVKSASELHVVQKHSLVQRISHNYTVVKANCC